MVSFLGSKVKGLSTLSYCAMVLLLGSWVSGAARADGASGLQGSGNEQSSDPFSSRGGDNSSNIMQLIHRVMQGEGNVDRAEQRASQKENVNEATSDFFSKQRERLKAAGAPAATPGVLSVGTPIAPGASGLIPQSGTTPLVITAPVIAPAIAPVAVPAPQSPTP